MAPLPPRKSGQSFPSLNVQMAWAGAAPAVHTYADLITSLCTYLPYMVIWWLASLVWTFLAVTKLVQTRTLSLMVASLVWTVLTITLLVCTRTSSLMVASLG